MDTTNFEKAQGHWILAKMGKKVLRPGGRELTMQLIDALSISNNDDVVEFAPGLGYTASLALQHHPKSYTGIDADTDAIKFLQKKFKAANIQFKLSNAADTKLPDATYDKVYGEAMLTMQADHRKSEIVKEAGRILKKGGLYAIHELGLIDNNISEEEKSEIQKDLALAIKVNARPLTAIEWQTLVENEGFKIHRIMTNSMHLMKPARIIKDEGFFRFLKIIGNVLTHPAARKRLMQMRKTFRKHQNNMNAIAIVAEKI